MTEFASQAPLALAAGLLSVLSPCVMPLMPAYLSLVSGISVEEMMVFRFEGGLLVEMWEVFDEQGLHAQISLPDGRTYRHI